MRHKSRKTKGGFDLLSDRVPQDGSDSDDGEETGIRETTASQKHEDVNSSKLSQANLRRDTFNSLSRYFQVRDHGDSEWLRFPEFPTEFEVSSIHPTTRKRESQEVHLQENILDQPWPSSGDYLEAQYRLMREDTVSTLRDAVEDMRDSPYQMENQSLKKIRIYNRVYITGLTVASEGIAHRLEFHTDRVEKKISWSQTKRLKPGTLVAVSPAEPRDALFTTRCLVGIVAARPLAEVTSETPNIDVYFGDTSMMDIDPQTQYVMVEGSNGYFEACRHTLMALQHMQYEKFPLSEHLVECKKEIDSPASLLNDPYVDISAALLTAQKFSVDILDGWPEVNHTNPANVVRADSSPIGAPGPPETSLDASQFEAYRRILTKRLAIVQGPPGTGKTHVSVIALRTLLTTRQPGDPPIVVTAQTNHALDQILRHISPYAADFIRLGGQTQDRELIEPRTLYNVKQNTPRHMYKELREAQSAANRTLQSIARRLREALAPLGTTSGEPMHPKVFLDEGLISSKQYTSLVEAKANWVGIMPEGADTPIGRWTSGDIELFQKARPERDLSALEMEDDDEDLYQLKDIELETGVVEDDEDRLYGFKIDLHPGYLCRRNESDKKIEALLHRYHDLNDIPAHRRGPIYNYLQGKVKERLLTQFRGLVVQARMAMHHLKIAKANYNASFLRNASVVGMTTTGLSKYRGLIDSLKPKIVLIEEAAETQEAYVTAACFESLEQLILVGDHLQLRAHCQNPELEEMNLHVSLFERLVHHHDVEFQQLTTQRRMLPEMRKILNVIYPKLTDHDTVLRRPTIPGMNGLNSWFMSHQVKESADEQFSWVNEAEAELVAGFFEYLVRNGTPPNSITVLTFYRGQQRKIRQLLRRRPYLRMSDKIQVSTVDAYQGEENEVILLSLVRNNDKGSIGFLSVMNRVCVAMSRARRGFYIFGNANLLVNSNKTWKKMLQRMLVEQRCGSYLPICCTTHLNTVKVTAGAHWTTCDGGCTLTCGIALPCGHRCQLFCHPETHDDLGCQQPCARRLPCEHQCSVRCCDLCSCNTCAEKAKLTRKQRQNLDGGLSLETIKTQDSELLVAIQELAQELTGIESEVRPVVQSVRCEPTSYQLKGHTQKDKMAGVQAYQTFSRGGVKDDDRRRAEAASQAHTEALEKAHRSGIDVTRGLMFGGAVPLRLASRKVEDISPERQGNGKPNHDLDHKSKASEALVSNSLRGSDPLDNDRTSRFASSAKSRSHEAWAEPTALATCYRVHQAPLVDLTENGEKQKLRKKYTHTWAPVQNDAAIDKADAGTGLENGGSQQSEASAASKHQNDAVEIPSLLDL